MSYFVRKIKKSNLPKIKTASTISQVLADVLDEYRVSNGDLSVWEIPTNSQADIDKAALALAITNEKLSNMVTEKVTEPRSKARYSRLKACTFKYYIKHKVIFR